MTALTAKADHLALLLHTLLADPAAARRLISRSAAQLMDTRATEADDPSLTDLAHGLAAAASIWANLEDDPEAVKLALRAYCTAKAATA